MSKAQKVEDVMVDAIAETMNAEVDQDVLDELAAEAAAEEQAAKVNARFIAEETMLGDMMATVVDHLKAMQKPWQQLRETEQRNIIYAIENRIKASIERVVAIIATNGLTSIPATLHKITIEKEIKIELHAFRRSADSMSELHDAMKSRVFIAIPYDLENRVGEDGKPTADADQGALTLDTVDDELGELEEEDTE